MAKRKKKEAFDWEDEDQEEIIWVSKSEIKRDAEDLKQLGEKLVNLTKANLTKVPLDDSLKDAIELAQRLQKEARRRQLQYIGKLLRSIDAEPIREALEKIEKDLAACMPDLQFEKKVISLEGNHTVVQDIY